MFLQIFRVAAPSIALAGMAFAQLEVSGSEAPFEKVPASASDDQRTAVFDENEIRALYTETKEENEKRAQRRPGHLSGENMELFEFKPLLVEARRIELPPDLNRKLDPNDLAGLWTRLDKIDPAEANLVRWQSRTDAEFMLGTYDNGGALGGNEGRLSVGLTAQQLARILGFGKEQEPGVPEATQR